MTRAGADPSRLPGHVTPIIAKSSGPPPAQCSTTTPTGDFPPNNDSGHSGGTGNIGYFNTLFPAGAIETPTPGALGGFSFPVYGSAGSPDEAGDCVGNQVRFVFAGLGVATLTIDPMGHNWRAVLQHRDGVIVTDQIRSGGPADTEVVFKVDACSPDSYHWIDVADNGPTCGGKWAFVGAHWQLRP